MRAPVSRQRRPPLHVMLGCGWPVITQCD
jgi:hypothetical protein